MVGHDGRSEETAGKPGYPAVPEKSHAIEARKRAFRRRYEP
jgi:hypothetical protein